MNFVYFQFVITQSNKLYTWGASPHLIRLLNQSRKRARMAQKFEDTKTALTNEFADKSKETNGLPNEEPDTKEQSEESTNQETIDLDSNKANNVESFEQNDTNEVPKSMSSKLTPSNLQDRIRNFLRSEKHPSEKSSEPDAASKINSEFYLDDEYTDHFLPNRVDTCDVAGEMIQVNDFLSFLNFKTKI